MTKFTATIMPLVCINELFRVFVIMSDMLELYLCNNELLAYY